MAEVVAQSDEFDKLRKACARALKAERLEEAASLLEELDSRGEPEVRLNARLAKKFSARLDHDSALRCAYRAWLTDTKDVNLLLAYAWAFKRAGRLTDAIIATAYAAVLYPGRADIKKNLVAWLTQAERFEEAESVAAELARLDPENAMHAHGRAYLLRRLGRIDDAAAALRELLDSDKAERADWERLQSFLVANGAHSEAAKVAAEIAERWPDGVEAQMRASALSSRAGRNDEAIDFAREAVARNPKHAAAHRRLSALLAGKRYNSEAFEHALIAARLAPDNPSNRVFLAGHYKRAGRLADAMSELCVALMLDPQNREALVDLIAVLKMRGQNTNAEQVRRQAEIRFPGDSAFAPGLDRDFDEDFWDGEVSDLSTETDQILERLAARANRRRIPDTWLGRCTGAIRDQVRVTWALMMREIKTRFGNTGWGYAWAFIEPLMHIGVLGVSMAMFKGDKAPLGHYYIVFHITGIVPYLTFAHTSQHLTMTLRSQVMLKLPLVQLNDVFFAKAILELLVGIVTTIGLLFGCYLGGYDYWPSDPLGMLTVLFFTWLIGVGTGITCCMIALKFEPWDMLWSNLCRILYFISGVFYIMDALPEMYLKYLTWNPLLHALTWNKVSFYHNYDPFILSRSYVVGWAVVSLLTGLLLERLLRRESMVYV